MKVGAALARFGEAESDLWEAVVAFAAYFMRDGSDEIVGEALKRRVLVAFESFALARKAGVLALRAGHRKGGRSARGGAR